MLCAYRCWLPDSAELSPFFVYASCAGPRLPGSGLLAGQADQEAPKQIRRGLPDVLDLLVICIEAGLSLDQATARTAEELRKAQPETVR